MKLTHKQTNRQTDRQTFLYNVDAQKDSLYRCLLTLTHFSWDKGVKVTII